MSNTDYDNWNGKTFWDRFKDRKLRLQHEKEKAGKQVVIHGLAPERKIKWNKDGGWYYESTPEEKASINEFFDRYRIEASRKSLNESIEDFLQQQKRQGRRGVLQNPIQPLTKILLRVRNTFAGILGQISFASAHTRRISKSKTSPKQLTSTTPTRSFSKNLK